MTIFPFQDNTFDDRAHMVTHFDVVFDTCQYKVDWIHIDKLEKRPFIPCEPVGHRANVRTEQENIVFIISFFFSFFLFKGKSLTYVTGSVTIKIF